MEISEVNPDGNVYQLKDATARTEISQIKAQNVYSLEETDTGKKWIDGKSIYKRVFTGNYSVAANSSARVVPITEFSNVETIIDIRMIQKESAVRSSIIPNIATSIEWNSTNSSGGIILYSTQAKTHCAFTICIEYTKTTG